MNRPDAAFVCRVRGVLLGLGVVAALFALGSPGARADVTTVVDRTTGAVAETAGRGAASVRTVATKNRSNGSSTSRHRGEGSAAGARPGVAHRVPRTSVAGRAARPLLRPVVAGSRQAVEHLRAANIHSSAAAAPGRRRPVVAEARPTLRPRQSAARRAAAAPSSRVTAGKPVRAVLRLGPENRIRRSRASDAGRSAEPAPRPTAAAGLRPTRSVLIQPGRVRFSDLVTRAEGPGGVAVPSTRLARPAADLLAVASPTVSLLTTQGGALLGCVPLIALDGVQPASGDPPALSPSPLSLPRPTAAPLSGAVLRGVEAHGFPAPAAARPAARGPTTGLVATGLLGHRRPPGTAAGVRPRADRQTPVDRRRPTGARVSDLRGAPASGAVGSDRCGAARADGLAALTVSPSPRPSRVGAAPGVERAWRLVGEPAVSPD